MQLLCFHIVQRHQLHSFHLYRVHTSQQAGESFQATTLNLEESLFIFSVSQGKRCSPQIQ